MDGTHHKLGAWGELEGVEGATFLLLRRSLLLIVAIRLNNHTIITVANNPSNERFEQNLVLAALALLVQFGRRSGAVETQVDGLARIAQAHHRVDLAEYAEHQMRFIARNRIEIET